MDVAKFHRTDLTFFSRTRMAPRHLSQTDHYNKLAVAKITISVCQPAYGHARFPTLRVFILECKFR